MADHVKRFYELLNVPGAIVRVDTPNPLGYDTANFGAEFAPALLAAASSTLTADAGDGELIARLEAYAKDQGGWHNIDETCELAAARTALEGHKDGGR